MCNTFKNVDELLTKFSKTNNKSHIDDNNNKNNDDTKCYDCCTNSLINDKGVLYCNSDSCHLDVLTR